MCIASSTEQRTENREQRTEIEQNRDRTENRPICGFCADSLSCAGLPSSLIAFCQLVSLQLPRFVSITFHLTKLDALSYNLVDCCEEFPLHFWSAWRVRLDIEFNMREKRVHTITSKLWLCIAYIHTYIQPSIHAYLHRQTQTPYLHTYVHMDIYTHIGMCMHIHNMYICA